MSIATKLAASALAAFTLGAIVSLAPGEAQARGACIGQRNCPPPVFRRECYWLPTVSNGSISGLRKVCHMIRY